jgi:hypothetical protein
VIFTIRIPEARRLLFLLNRNKGSGGILLSGLPAAHAPVTVPRLKMSGSEVAARDVDPRPPGEVIAYFLSYIVLFTYIFFCCLLFSGGALVNQAFLP